MARNGTVQARRDAKLAKRIEAEEAERKLRARSEYMEVRSNLAKRLVREATAEGRKLNESTATRVAYELLAEFYPTQEL